MKSDGKVIGEVEVGEARRRLPPARQERIEEGTQTVELPLQMDKEEIEDSLFTINE